VESSAVKLLVDPHGDDSVLFACYMLLRERPHVLVTHRSVPRQEIRAALTILGCSWSEGQTIWAEPSLLIHPAYEDEGHAEHNRVAELASELPAPKVAYLTYAPRGVRSHLGQEIIPTPREIALKLRALACFESQIANPLTRPWFYDLLDMREWVRA
jgi:hypothetical protein